MILSLTFNPAVDKTLFVSRLALGKVNRVGQSQIDPGGKGINVSRVVHRLDRPTIAFGFLAGNFGTIIARALDESRPLASAIASPAVWGHPQAARHMRNYITVSVG